MVCKVIIGTYGFWLIHLEKHETKFKSGTAD